MVASAGAAAHRRAGGGRRSDGILPGRGKYQGNGREGDGRSREKPALSLGVDWSWWSGWIGWLVVCVPTIPIPRAQRQP